MSQSDEQDNPFGGSLAALARTVRELQKRQGVHEEWILSLQRHGDFEKWLSDAVRWDQDYIDHMDKADIGGPHWKFCCGKVEAFKEALATFKKMRNGDGLQD